MKRSVLACFRFLATFVIAGFALVALPQSAAAQSAELQARYAAAREKCYATPAPPLARAYEVSPPAPESIFQGCKTMFEILVNGYNSDGSAPRNILVDQDQVSLVIGYFCRRSGGAEQVKFCETTDKVSEPIYLRRLSSVRDSLQAKLTANATQVAPKTTPAQRKACLSSDAGARVVHGTKQVDSGLPGYSETVGTTGIQYSETTTNSCSFPLYVVCASNKVSTWTSHFQNLDSLITEVPANYNGDSICNRWLEVMVG